MQTVFEAAGGNEGLRRLAYAWHKRVMADDVVAHAFSHGLPGRPGELHPEPPTEPDVNLSIHPARATQRRLPPSIKDVEFIRCPVDSFPTWVTRSLCSAGITPLPRYYEAVRP